MKIWTLQKFMENIKSIGLIQPISITKINPQKKDNPLHVCRKNKLQKYVIISGQRRFNAFKKLNLQYPKDGWDKISCYVIFSLIRNYLVSFVPQLTL